VVVDSDAQLLFAAEVLLGRLHADMPEEELDLLQFASRNVAQTGTCTLQIVRGKVAKLSFRGKLLDHAPDHFFGDTFALRGLSLAHTPKDRPEVTRAAVVQESSAVLTY
jgi:hypothetical protein